MKNIARIAVCGLFLAACAPRDDSGTIPPGADIATLQTMILDGETSCVAVVQHYLDRIGAYDQPLGINAISMVNPAALERAAEIDATLAAGEMPGPLFCAPLLVKDNFDTHDMPTTGGSVALAESLPPDDAFMVARLREADAIVIAKTNMAEWAFNPRETVSSTRGVTANAYDRDFVPAGSSGGTASGVAADFAVAGLGTDTGNSIRGPSAHLGLFGIRSTLGLTSRDGIIPLVLDRDVAGPMTRTVADAARLFTILAAHDPADPLSGLGEGQYGTDYTDFLNETALQGARIGVLAHQASAGMLHPEVNRLFRAALADMEAAGATITPDVTVPGWDDFTQAETFCPTFRYDMANYLDSLGGAAPVRDVKEAYDAGLYTQTPAASHDYVKEGLEFFLQFPADIPPEEWETPCIRYPANETRNAFRAAILAVMEKHDLDVLVFPTWGHPPAHLDAAFEEYRGDHSQVVAPETGLPAATVPMGLLWGRLPAGLQIVARPFDEETIFAIAYAYEQAAGHKLRPADLPPLQQQ